MKKTLFALTLAPVAFVLTACGNEAITYNNSISKKTLEVQAAIEGCNTQVTKEGKDLKAENAVAKTEKIVKCLNDVVKLMDTKKEEITKLGAYKKDDSFQKATLTYFDESKKSMEMFIELAGYRKELPTIKTEDDFKNYQNKMVKKQKEITVVGKAADQAFKTAQTAFAKKYGFELK